MLMLPVDEACWDVWKLLLLLLLLPALLPVPIPLVPLPESSSASIRFLLPLEDRTTEALLLLEVARETVIREDGLGDSFNLNTVRQ